MSATTGRNSLTHEAVISITLALHAKPDAWWVANRNDPIRVAKAIKAEMGVELNPNQVRRLMRSLGKVEPARNRGQRNGVRRLQAVAMSVAMALKEFGCPISAILLDIAHGSWRMNQASLEALETKFYTMFPRPTKTDNDTDADTD